MNVRLVLIGAGISIISIIISVIMFAFADDSFVAATSFEATSGDVTAYYDTFEVSDGFSSSALEVTAPNVDLYILIYNQTFDPSNPTKNIFYQFNCDPLFDNGNNPCTLPETSSLTGNFTIVITTFSDGDVGDWQVNDGATELATGTLSTSDEKFIRPNFTPLFSGEDDNSSLFAGVGFLLCCLGPLLGMILLIIGIASKDPATVAAMTMVSSAPLAASHISEAGQSAGAFVASQSPLSQPVVHGAVPSATQQTPTTPLSTTSTSPATETTTPTSAPTTIATAPTTAPITTPPSVPTPEQLGISSQFTLKEGMDVSDEDGIEGANESGAGDKFIDEPTLTVEQLYVALGKTFTTSDRKEILSHAPVISVNMTIEDVERTMGVGISPTHKSGQTITGKMQNGYDIEIRLPKSAVEVNEGDGWTGSGRAVEWNGIRRILIIESN